jgi:hypothetical protein
MSKSENDIVLDEGTVQLPKDRNINELIVAQNDPEKNIGRNFPFRT